MKELIVSPSILSLDFSRLGEQLDALANSQAAWLHFDVMDGHFVPNLTFGPDILRGFRRRCRRRWTCTSWSKKHVTYADVFIDAGADVLTFHAKRWTMTSTRSAHCARISANAACSPVSASGRAPLPTFCSRCSIRWTSCW